MNLTSEEIAERPDMEIANHIVETVKAWWCHHVRQGMCQRCQLDRVRDVAQAITDYRIALEEQDDE